MITYERNIKDKLFVLRLIFVTIAIGLFISIANGFVNLHYVIISALIFISLINVTGLKIYGKEIEVTRYFVFGLLLFRWTYNEQSNNIKLYRKYDVVNVGESSDTWVDLIGIFLFRKVKIQFMTLYPQKLIFKLGDIDVNLSDYEYEIISEIISN